MAHRGVFVVLILTVTAVTACGTRQDEPAGEAPPPLAVTTARAEAVDLQDRLEAGGIVTARETATIAARITAPVESVRVRAGERVRRGDVLVTLDSRDLSAHARAARADAQAAAQAVMQARSEQAAAAADQRLADAWHGRMATLQARNSATAQELDEAEARRAAAAARAAATAAAVEQATARVAGTQAAAEAAEVSGSFTIVRAPFAGVVTERLIDPGTLASAGTPLLRVDGDGLRQVEARVDEARVAYVRPGDRVAVSLDGQGREIEGTVAEVARAIAQDQRTFTVKVSLPADIAPRTGTFAGVRFRGAPRRAVVVPSTAVRRQGQVTSVFTVEGNVARIRLVQIGAADGDRVEVVSGLDAGEQVVVSPSPMLTDGRRVTAAAGGGTP